MLEQLGYLFGIVAIAYGIRYVIYRMRKNR
ncbi:hypothetical protein JOC73_002080 [Alkaliphilus hydrothermalis]|uniref:Uncharacterized protein n=1 Tax=Alkaliphilus hydrothermalis TaxID=1482730 RepID=A0ABS2NRC4_9FIRM|nr:hypothetical protein [Alkaliphilus hydrothermalis]